jgi:hypothetical protein
MCRNYSEYSKFVIQISMKSLYCMLTYTTACVIFRALNIIWWINRVDLLIYTYLCK